MFLGNLSSSWIKDPNVPEDVSRLVVGDYALSVKIIPVDKVVVFLVRHEPCPCLECTLFAEHSLLVEDLHSRPLPAARDLATNSQVIAWSNVVPEGSQTPFF